MALEKVCGPPNIRTYSRADADGVAMNPPVVAKVLENAPTTKSTWPRIPWTSG
jgi:hypothetical protein